jgi:site-specific DNA recombinase
VPGLDRQVTDGTEAARKFGAKRIRIYRDGVSAYKRKVIREGFSRLLEDIEGGAIQCVVAWKVERFARQPRDVERLMDALGADENDPRGYAITWGDHGDTRTEAGKFMFRQLVQFGRWESAAISDRVRRARRAAIEGGRFSGSPPAFGHRDGTKWREIVPDEAQLIREGARRLITGEGIRSILRDFNERGSRTRRGALWQHRAWIMMICSARMVGLRMVGDAEYDGGSDDQGHPWIAPILDRESWERVREILRDPARRPHNPGGMPRHLLTGLMRCKLCNGVLRAKGNMGKSHGPHYWTYGCVKDAYHTEACGRVWIKGSNTDDYIEEVVRAHLRMPEVRRALTHVVAGEADQPDEELLEVRHRFAEIQEQIYEREALSLDGARAVEQGLGVSMEGFRRWKQRAQEERDRLEKQIGRLSRAKSTLRAIADPEQFWDQATLEERRDLVRSLFVELSVMPASAVEGPPSRRWDRRRIEWTAVGK